MKILNRLRIAKIIAHLVLNPKRTDLIFKGVKIVSEDGDQKLFTEIEKAYLNKKDFMALYESGYNPVPPTLAQLSHYSEGTFGRALYHHLKVNHLNLEIFPRFECSRPIEYLSLRAYQDHDLWHVLLGYSIEIEEELAVQAFGAAQYGSPIAVLLIAGGLLHLLWKAPLRAVSALHEVSESYQRGKTAKLLAGMRLHDIFDRPLDEVRRACGLSESIRAAV